MIGLAGCEINGMMTISSHCFLLVAISGVLAVVLGQICEGQFWLYFLGDHPIVSLRISQKVRLDIVCQYWQSGVLQGLMLLHVLHFSDKIMTWNSL